MANKQPGKQGASPSVLNRKARFNYDILETYEAGMVLTGSEVKSLREGKISLNEAYVRIIGDKPWLVGATIAHYEHAGKDSHDPDQKRKLLLHNREINRLIGKVKEKGLTIVPLRMYFNARGYAKLEIGLARGKARYDKRRQIRDRDMTRDLARQARKYRK